MSATLVLSICAVLLVGIVLIVSRRAAAIIGAGLTLIVLAVVVVPEVQDWLAAGLRGAP